MDTLRNRSWSAGLAGVLLVAVAALTACDADESVSSTPSSTGPTSSTPSPTSDPTESDPPDPEVAPHPAAMPEVPLRSMYARGSAAEGVLVSAAGTTGTGLAASAYVPTRAGAVFTSGDQVYDLADGGTPVAIGSVTEASVFLQVDPTLRYVAWEVRRPDGRHARVFVHDVVAHRTVLDRVLPWGGRAGPLRIASFGAARLRLVQLPESDFWIFATVTGRTLVTPGGQVVDLRSREVEGPEAGRGLWSPGLRYRVSAPRGRHPWQVVDLTTGRDVTPATLLRPAARAARLTGWLGNTTFGVLTSSGTWRDSTVTASVCRVAGACRVVWRHHQGADDSGLQQSTEIG